LPIIGGSELSKDAKFYETLAGVAGAFLVGVGGSRVLTSEVDKKLLKLAASTAAGRKADPNRAAELAVRSPAEALKAANELEPA
jgi:hypothetical protein